MDRVDRQMNAASPVVQASPRPDHLELVLPSAGVTVELHHRDFLDVFGHGMRLITGVDATGVSYSE